MATQQTGWGFIATTRSWMPDSLKGVLWFGPDDSSTTPHLPVYGSATRAPASYAGKGVQDGVISPMLKFDMANAFYAFNLVGNWVQTRWNDMYPDLHKAIIDAETKFQSALIEMDEKASTIHRTAGQTACVEAVTSWSANLGDSLVQQWNALFGELFVKFRDGYKIVPDPDDLSCGCSVGNAPYSESWYDAIVDSTGDHYLVPETGPEGNGDYSSSKPKKFHSRSKLDLLNRR